MKLLFVPIIIMITLAASDEDCGRRTSIHPLIFGGSAVNVGDFPWLIPLIRKFNDKFFCGSNLITHQHVLTGKLYNCIIFICVVTIEEFRSRSLHH